MRPPRPSRAKASPWRATLLGRAPADRPAAYAAVSAMPRGRAVLLQQLGDRRAGRGSGWPGRRSRAPGSACGRSTGQAPRPCRRSTKGRPASASSSVTVPEAAMAASVAAAKASMLVGNESSIDGDRDIPAGDVCPDRGGDRRASAGRCAGPETLPTGDATASPNTGSMAPDLAAPAAGQDAEQGRVAGSRGALRKCRRHPRGARRPARSPDGRRSCRQPEAARRRAARTAGAPADGRVSARASPPAPARQAQTCGAT